ncbi:MAG: tetratricopeptide repeat protein [Deltaproteobacteria bacterium]|jgi:tetratricopeptide (TPR) repeat protein|nr:tetratricopeptide repeat protein [Deltaproteobacteria bacterium]
MNGFQQIDPDLHQAKELEQAGFFDEAATLYRRLIENHPDENSYLLALAWVYHDGGHKDEALACFRKLFERELRHKVFSGFAFDELVRLYKENGSLDLLVDVCERAVHAQPNDLSLLGDLGDAYMRGGRPRDAVGVFEKMANMDPDAVIVYCYLGNAYVAMGEIELAQGAYGKAVALEPDKKEVFYTRLAEACRKAGCAVSAEKILRDCLRDSENPLLFLDLADIHVELGRVDEGETLLAQAIRMEPVRAGTFLNRFGNSLAKAGLHELAIDYFKQAVKTDPRNPFYYTHLAASCTAIGREDIVAEVLGENNLL